MAKKKKKMPGLNTSSTADISFMLLIFFLVTTSMDTDMGLARRLPQPPDPDQEDAQIDVKERNVLNVRLNAAGMLMVNHDVMDIKELRARMSEAGFRLNISQSAKDFVAEAGYDPNYGARPLKRAIQKYIENPVSEFIIADRTARRLSRTASEGRTLRIGLSPSGDTLDLKLAD